MAIDTKEYPNKVKQNLWANKQYNIFFYNFTLNSKRYRGLIDLSDKVGWNKKDRIEFAESRLIIIKNNKKDSVFDDNINLDNYMDKYFALLNNSGWTNIQKSYYRNHISGPLGKKKLKDIRSIHIKEFIKELEQKEVRGKKLSVRSLKLSMEILSPAFNEAMDNRIIDFNPTSTVKIKRPVTKKIVTNATAELKKISEAVDDEFGDDPFYKALFLFAMQGRRRAEILNLEWVDVDFDNNMYILRDTKNAEEQKIFLPENIKNVLDEFKDSGGRYVFGSRISKDKPIQNTKHIINKMKVRLENPSFGLHYLRNVIVSAMAEQGLESMYLSGALGHNDPNTVKKYLTMNYLKSSEMASGVISGIVGK